MKLVQITVILLALSGSVVTGLAHSKELERDANEQEAFKEGCDKNQLNLNFCSGYDYKVKDAKLNDLYKQQMSRIKGTNDEKRFINAEKAWLKYVEADCLYQVGPREESGTIWALLENNCKISHFEQRIKLLQSFVECTQDGCIGR